MRKPLPNNWYCQTRIEDSRIERMRMEGYVLIEGSVYLVQLAGKIRMVTQTSWDTYNPHEGVFEITEAYAGKKIHGDSWKTQALGDFVVGSHVEMIFDPNKEPDLAIDMDMTSYRNALTLKELADEMGYHDTQYHPYDEENCSKQSLANYLVYCLWQQRFHAFYRYMKDHDCADNQDINCWYFGRNNYKYTDAGVSTQFAIGFGKESEMHYEDVSEIEFWRINAMAVSSIVEGSDAEVPAIWIPTIFFDIAAWESAVMYVNDEACRLWEEANEPQNEEDEEGLASVSIFVFDELRPES